jgi:O-antigen/teichoic acid export membrane protein
MAGMVSGFVISIITSRLLGTYGRGELAEFSASLNFLHVFLGLGIAYSLLFVISGRKYDPRKTFSSGILLLIILGILAFLFFALERFLGASFFFPDLGFLPNIILILSFVQLLLNGIINAFLNGNKLFFDQQKATAIFSLVSALCYLVVFFLPESLQPDLSGIEAFLVFYILVNSLLTLLLLAFFIRKVKLPGESGFLSFPQFTFLLKIGFLAWLTNVFQYFATKLEFYFIEDISGKSELGIYSLAINISRFALMVPVAISTVLLPYNASENDGELVPRNNAIIRYLIPFLGIPFLVFLPFYELLFGLFFGPGFSRSGLIFMIIFPGVLALAIMMVLTSYFGGKGMFFVNAIGAFVSLVLFSILTPFLTNLYGIEGAGIANAISFFGGFLFVLVIYLRKTGSGMSDLLFIRSDDIKRIKSRLFKSKRK